MTIKFFPLYFKDETGLSPSLVNLIYAATPITMAAASLGAQRVSARYGRISTIIATKVVGISLLYSMWTMGLGYDEKSGEVPPLWANAAIIVPVYIVRTVIMNCTSPLKKSILNEYVPSNARGRWNAFDSVTRFGWSGSAMLGGAIADSYGYGATFLATAAVQTQVCARGLVCYVRRGD